MTSTDTEAQSQGTVIDDIQNETGKPGIPNKSEELKYAFENDRFKFEICSVRWKNRKTGEFDEPRIEMKLGGPKNKEIEIDDKKNPGKKVRIKVRDMIWNFPADKESLETFEKMILPKMREFAYEREKALARIVDNT